MFNLLGILLLPLLAVVFSFLVGKRRSMIEGAAVAAVLIECIATARIVVDFVKNQSVPSFSLFHPDALGIFVLTIISFVALFVTLYSIVYLREEFRKEIIGFRRVREFYVLLHLFLFAMYVAVTTSSPVLMWIAIEATTLSTAFLISFYNKPSTVEAAWKYLIVNSVGLLLGFFGTILYVTFASNSPDGLIEWKTILSQAPLFHPQAVKIAFVFVLIGFGTKVGLVPMHTWLPDAHSKAPVPISSLLSGVLLNVAFVAVLRFKLITDAATGTAFTSSLLIFFGILSLVLAAFILFIQHNYKRLLAYSSIEHMGIIAFGFGIGGAAIMVSLLHMLYHSLAKSLIFLLSGNIFLKYSSTKLANVRGVLYRLPVTGILFFLAFLALAGMPPFGFFFTELHILAAAVQQHPYVTAIAVAALAIAFVGFFKQVNVLLFGKAPENIPKGELNQYSILIPAFLFVAFLLVTFFPPEALKELIDATAKLLT